MFHLVKQIETKVNKKVALRKTIYYTKGMKTVIGIKVSKEFKEIIKNAAQDENRSLSNFIKHCILTYLKEKKGIEHKEVD